MTIPDPVTEGAGIAEIGTVLAMVERMGPFLTFASPLAIGGIFEALSALPEKDRKDVLNQITGGLKLIDSDVGSVILDPLMSESMGLDVGRLKESAGPAYETVAGAIGFGITLEMVTAYITTAMKALGGNHGSEAIANTIGKLPESIGLNYFLGTVMALIFENAVAEPLREAINIQTHPARLDIGTLRQALKQHKITIDEAAQYKDKLGYTDNDWKVIQSLDSQLVPIADLQTAYDYGILNETQIKDYLTGQGFSDTDADLLMTIYLHKSQTAGGEVYRTVARNAYVHNFISEAQFRGVLEKANIPSSSIDLEIAGLNLQKQMGLAHFSLAEIKSLYQQGAMPLTEVNNRLGQLGYPESDITYIVNQWVGEGRAGKVGKTAITILRYLVSSLISPHEAYQQLVNLGIRPEDANFLIQHPSALGSGYAHSLDANTVIAAYKDGIITVDAAREKLAELALSPEDIDTRLNIATYSIQHTHKPKASHQELSTAEVKEVFDLGLGSEHWAIRTLQDSGYSEQHAQIIVAIWYTKANGRAPGGWTTLN